MKKRVDKTLTSDKKKSITASLSQKQSRLWFIASDDKEM
jgi:hypothetical protein